MARKKQQGVKRTASGRKSRAAIADVAHLDPIETRMRLFKLNREQAHNQKAETVTGRLCLTGVVTEDQYLAAQKYIGLREAFKRAVKAPDALRTGSGGGDAGESPGYAEWCQDAIRHYENADKAVMREQCKLENRGRNLVAGLDYIVCRSEQVDHLVPDALIALDALVHHFSGRKVKRLDDAPQIAA
jgi:hypothetical protein